MSTENDENTLECFGDAAKRLSRLEHQESIKEEFRILGLFDGYVQSMKFVETTFNDGEANMNYSKVAVAEFAHRMFLKSIGVYLND